ncbi:GntR family transcriptional regulator [Sphingomonas sp. 22176]|uniref:GntR family transcriptional regulator n=1 Tax=Sphingomonas sp. 22176 TaxID=3453884 RepID=UPI003F86B127
MNAGQTAERVHGVLRMQIMHGLFRPGGRLDPAVLATTLASSVTPVRDALHRLTGEGLVETRTAGGFYLSPLDEPRLEDLYDWSGELLLLAVRAWRSPFAPGRTAEMNGDVSLADRTAALFLAIAHHSQNGEHAHAVDRLNAHVHAVRMVEPAIIGATDAELDALAASVSADDHAAFRRLCASYHRRRRRAAAALVRAVYRAR